MILKSISMLLISYLYLNAQVLPFEFPVGTKFNEIENKKIQIKEIREYSNLKANIYRDINLNETESMKFIANRLFLFSDSINAPKAFIIKSVLNNNQLIYKCIKKETSKIVVEEENCAIRKQLDGPLIEYKRQHFFLDCIKESFSSK